MPSGPRESLRGEENRPGAGQVNPALPGRHHLAGGAVNFDTADALCRRVYELSDTYGLGHVLTHRPPEPWRRVRRDRLPLPCIPTGWSTCSSPPSPWPSSPALPALPYGKRPYRRIRMDAMGDPDLLRRNRARLRFSRKVSGALMEEAVESLEQAKSMHDDLRPSTTPRGLRQGLPVAKCTERELLAGL